MYYLPYSKYLKEFSRKACIEGVKLDKQLNPDHKLLEKWKRAEMMRMEIAWIEQVVDQKK